jgi:cell division septum initiation protein DivIVA
MDIDRQAIERRDFPIARRGYEPAAVDAHLRALANEIEQLQRELSDGGAAPASLASTAGTQVQSILAAAEETAAELERDAVESARRTREEADRDAASTREQAIAQARGQVAFVAQATAALLERVGSMDAEVGALVDSVRAGADRLAADLSAVETNMGELYDAAAGNPAAHAVSGNVMRQSIPVPPPATPHLGDPGPAAPQAAGSGAKPTLSPPETTEAGVHLDPEAPVAASGTPQAATESGDLDGARLVALNMALNGESREEAERYLAENYELVDRGKLIDEVYAAIEG